MLVEACATRSPEPIVVAPSSAPVFSDDVLPIQYGDKLGVFIPEAALGDILAGIEHEKGAIQRDLAREQVMRQIADERVKEIEKSQAFNRFFSAFAPPIAFVVGILLGGIVAWQVTKR